MGQWELFLVPELLPLHCAHRTHSSLGQKKGEMPAILALELGHPSPSLAIFLQGKPRELQPLLRAPSGAGKEAWALPAPGILSAELPEHQPASFGSVKP